MVAEKAQQSGVIGLDPLADSDFAAIHADIGELFWKIGGELGGGGGEEGGEEKGEEFHEDVRRQV